MSNTSNYLWNRVADDRKRICSGYMESFPVQVGAMARDLGLNVVSATLRSGISGMIKPSEQSFTIKVNRHENNFRQRFTVAHEISHFLLHEPLIQNGIVDSVLYRSNVSDKVEAEANKLAADILMPRNTLRNWLSQHYPQGVSETDLQNVSNYIKVSKVALKIRLGI